MNKSFEGSKNADPAPANTQWRPEDLKGQKYTRERERRKKLRMRQQQLSTVNQYCLPQKERTKQAGDADWKIRYLFG